MRNKTCNKNNIFSHKNVKRIKQSIKNTTLRDKYICQYIKTGFCEKFKSCIYKLSRITNKF